MDANKKPTYIQLSNGYFYVNSYEGLSDISNMEDKKQAAVLILGDQIKKIEKNAFKNFPNLQAVFYSDRLMMIHESAFENCKKLETFVIYTYGIAKFLEAGHHINDMIGIGQFEINSGLDFIGKNAFKNTAFKDIEIYRNGCKISTGAFESCKKLHTLKIFAQDIKAQKGAFYDCPKLKLVSGNKNLIRWFEQHASASVNENKQSSSKPSQPHNTKHLHGKFEHKRVENKNQVFDENDLDI